LLLIWVVLYLCVGFAFASIYKVLPCAVEATETRACESSFRSLVYFSFVTQSTVGYGDYVPSGIGRELSILQVLIGLTMYALVLGIVVFKALKRSNPLIFSTYLVYELEKHKFWFRFINVDADQLRDVDFKVQFVQFAGRDNNRTDYDTQANAVKIDVDHFDAVPPLRLFANRSKSNEGVTPVADSDRTPLILSPVHFSCGTTKYVESTIRGYFESTGDIFFHSKRYFLKDIRCGSFDGVDNNELQTLPDGEKARILSDKLDSIISTSAEKCRQCPHHGKCELDVAVKTRTKPA
jgi:hypothetical protein